MEKDREPAPVGIQDHVHTDVADQAAAGNQTVGEARKELLHHHPAACEQAMGMVGLRRSLARLRCGRQLVPLQDADLAEVVCKDPGCEQAGDAAAEHDGAIGVLVVHGNLL